MAAVTINMLVTAGIVVMLYTVLYGDNPISRIAQAIYMGVQSGYLLMYNLDFFYDKGVVRAFMEGKFIYIIPVILGLMLFARLYEGTRWLYRYPMAIIVGTMLGVSIRTTVFSQIIDQVSGNFPPHTPLIGVPAGETLNNLIIIVGSLCAIVFFVFSHEFKGPERYIHRAGRLFLLAAFGGSYGNTVSYRYELMAGSFISNLLTPAELVPYTLGIIALVGLVLIVSFKTGIAQWE